MTVFKISDASKYAGVSINTLKKLADDGYVRSFKTPKGHRRFEKSALDEYMAGYQPVKSKQKNVFKEHLKKFKNRFNRSYVDVCVKELNEKLDLKPKLDPKSKTINHDILLAYQLVTTEKLSRKTISVISSINNTK